MRRNPVTILFIVPILWFLGLRVGNCGWFILKPVIGFLSVFVDNLKRLIFVPIFRLLGRRVRDPCELNPIFWLFVLRVVNLLSRVDCGREVFQKRPILHRLIVDQQLEGIVGFDDESIEGGKLAGL